MIRESSPADRHEDLGQRRSPTTSSTRQERTTLLLVFESARNARVSSVQSSLILSSNVAGGDIHDHCDPRRARNRFRILETWFHHP
jgi:hypothetical protein